MGHGAGGGQETVDSLLAELTRFTEEEREQEDDIVPLTLERSKAGMADRETTLGPDARDHNGNRQIIADFTLTSEPGNERPAMEKVADAVKELPLSGQRLARLKTAVAEATMNAMEHGNKYRAEDVPDLEAKLAGAQTPRCWGLFLIERMVDEVRVSVNADHHSIELLVRLEEGN